jgi:transposase
MDIIIGIDPHKSSHTAVALNAAGEVLGELRVAAGKQQVDQLQTFANRWPQRRWAVEGANGLGRLLAQQLVGAGEAVTDVPATLSARVRLLSGGSARKSDSHDARSTAIAALHGQRLREVGLEDVTVVLRLLSDRRDQLCATRNRIVCRLHNHLRHLRPGGAAVNLTAERAGRLLQGIRPQGVVAVQRKQLARELLADLRKVDKQLADIDQRIAEAVTASRTTLTDVVGIGPILAAAIIGHAGDIDRFPSRAHFASYAGTAPIEASRTHDRPYTHPGPTSPGDSTVPSSAPENPALDTQRGRSASLPGSVDRAGPAHNRQSSARRQSPPTRAFDVQWSRGSRRWVLGSSDPLEPLTVRIDAGNVRTLDVNAADQEGLLAHGHRRMGALLEDGSETATGPSAAPERIYGSDRSAFAGSPTSVWTIES